MIIQNDQKKSLLSYFLRGEALKRVYDTAATGVGLLNSFFVIHYLSVFHFGLYQLILSLVAILDGLSTGLLETIVGVEMRRHLNVAKKEMAKRLYLEHAVVKIVFAFLLTAGVFFGATFIAGYYGEDIALFVRIAGFLILIRALQSLETTFFKSVVSFAHWSFPAIREVVKLILLVSFLFAGRFTILEVVLAHVLAELVSLIVVTLFSFIRTYRMAFGMVTAYESFVIAPLLKAQGWWIFIRFGLSKITKNTMPWFIKFFINTEAVAYYSLAINLVAFIENLLPLSGIEPILGLKADNRGESSFIFKRSIKYSLWLGILMLIGALLFVPPAVVFLFPKYKPAITLFMLLVLALPLYSAYKLLKVMLTVLREQKVLTLRIANEVLIIPVGAVICLPIFGLLGAGIVYIATYVERVWFFYSRLATLYPEFRIKLKSLFVFDDVDRQYVLRVLRRNI